MILRMYFFQVELLQLPNVAAPFPRGFSFRRRLVVEGKCRLSVDRSGTLEDLLDPETLIAACAQCDLPAATVLFILRQLWCVIPGWTCCAHLGMGQYLLFP
jgi:hypothetical protein